jgi:hypothetical protein
VQGKYFPVSRRGISEARSVSKGEPDEAASAGGVGVCSLFPFIFSAENFALEGCGEISCQRTLTELARAESGRPNSSNRSKGKPNTGRH